LRGTPTVSNPKSLNGERAGSGIESFILWQETQFPFAGFLKSARPRASSAVKAARWRITSSYFDVNGDISSLRRNASTALPIAFTADSGPSIGPTARRRSTANALAVILCASWVTSRFPISSALRSGCRVRSASESVRPSQKKPPTPSGSGASSSQWKWKR